MFQLLLINMIFFRWWFIPPFDSSLAAAAAIVHFPKFPLIYASASSRPMRWTLSWKTLYRTDQLVAKERGKPFTSTFNFWTENNTFHRLLTIFSRFDFLPFPNGKNCLSLFHPLSSTRCLSTPSTVHAHLFKTTKRKKNLKIRKKYKNCRRR